MAEPLIYRCTSVHGGINTRWNGRRLSDVEATQLTNAVIDTPGLLTKAWEPSVAVTLDANAVTPVNGLKGYVYGGTPYLVATLGGTVYRWDGTNAATNPTGAATIASSGGIQMVQTSDDTGASCIVGVDGNNKPFKLVDTVLSDITITGLTAPQAIAEHMNRVLYGQGDSLYTSAVGNPASVPTAALTARKGSGDTIVNILPIAWGKVLVIKAPSGGTGFGSIHMADYSSGVPSSLIPVMDRIAIVGGRCVVRGSNVDEADVLLMTHQGVRSLKYTLQDEVQGAGLPLSDNLKTYFDELNAAQLSGAHAQMFEDQYMLWIPTTDSTNPDLVFVDSFKVPKENTKQGWTVLDMRTGTAQMAGYSSEVFGFTGKPSLYIGSNTGGKIYKAFNAAGTAFTFSFTSKRIDFGNADPEKVPFKLTVHHDVGSSGTVNYYLIDETGAEYLIGQKVLTGGGLTAPLTSPFTLTPGSPAMVPWHAGLSSAGAQLPGSHDWRVKITCTGDPKIVEWTLYAHANPPRFDNPTGDSAQPTDLAAMVTEDNGAAMITGY